MAKAFGNLGNTFKSLKNYVNAIRCCEKHLEITRQLHDRLGEGRACYNPNPNPNPNPEGRACYNLGNVHHALGKVHLSNNAADGQATGKTCLLQVL